jgi:hypothetical protein
MKIKTTKGTEIELTATELKYFKIKSLQKLNKVIESFEKERSIGFNSLSSLK